VKLLNRVGGAALALIALIMIVTGIQSSTGQSILGPIGTSLSRSWDWIRTNLPTIPAAAGNAGVALVIALALFSAGVIFIPAVRGGRNMVILAVIATAIGFVAYQPSLIGR